MTGNGGDVQPAAKRSPALPVAGVSAGAKVCGPCSSRRRRPGCSDRRGPRRRQTRVEYGFRPTDGRQIEMGLSAAPLMTPRGETGFILTFQDVTESRKLEREARVQQRLAAVGEMAAGIAHEIAIRSASMSGSIQILRQELPLTDEQGQLMDIVIRGSRSGSTRRSKLPGLRAAAAAVDAPHGRAAGHHRYGDAPAEQSERSEAHRIAVDVPGDRSCSRPTKDQIRQIVWNLATNGLRAMPSAAR